MNKAFSLIAGLLLAASAGAIAADNTAPEQQPLEKIAPFPAAETGMSRQVIYLPQRPDEDRFKVELLIGKNLEVDCNRHMLGGKLKSHTLEGWGYDYLVMNEISEGISTTMACPESANHQAFVTANLGSNTMQRYNSRLPIVVYVPQGVEVKYRLWEASKDVHSAQEK
ncbi:serine protease inhibitor ecotin [Yersinia nurmii]|uniref:Ecotin n=1 Tax=Yersinia nurmii TaxID=685706 RepID=A0AAW7K1G0_9GAMM|nr:serine protease inhibitor ecotin [Yersinia nurmii]MDN0087070.1 serine protease inhibitor ecotin [Yersinia nurmii]CNE13927.1 ecotin [Yersinia nurmii]